MKKLIALPDEIEAEFEENSAKRSNHGSDQVAPPAPRSKRPETKSRKSRRDKNLFFHQLNKSYQQKPMNQGVQQDLLQIMINHHLKNTYQHF